jgi:two-component system, NtrC family, sensor kinase
MEKLIQSQKMNSIRVLLVDDESDFRATTAKRLGKRGIDVYQSDSGKKCLETLKKDSDRVVVMDVKMPGMDGIETLDRIKEQFPETEVILLTGHSSAEDGVEGIKKGAFDYLAKPLEFEHLLEKIRQAHDRQRRFEEKKQEKEFRTQMEQQMIATERLAALGTLSTGVAHEINNPLAMMRESAGYMRLLLEKKDMTDIPRRKELKRGLDMLEKGIERIRRITHMMLGFVKNKEEMLSETRLKDLIEEALELMAREAKDKDIEFITEMTETDGIIWSDPYQIRQVMVNLLANGVHSIDKEGIIKIGLIDTNDSVILTVSDSGQGIPKENIDKIFEPFFSTKSPDKGTGLGLYVSRSIVNKLGGEIIVRSEMGKGTTFTVTIPKRRSNGIECENNKDICDDILKKIKEMNHNGPDTGKSSGC